MIHRCDDDIVSTNILYYYLTSKHRHIHKHVHTHRHTRADTHIRAHTNEYTHADIHTDTHTHIHTLTLFIGEVGMIFNTIKLHYACSYSITI